MGNRHRHYPTKPRKVAQQFHEAQLPSAMVAAPLPPSGRRQYALMALLLCMGLFYSNHALFLSKFRLSPGDFSDAKLINYILEHDYRWLIQRVPHTKFWDTPMYYPEPNVTAYTDLLLGALPQYALWRFLGFAPDTSFQLWILVACILNYISCYLLLHWVLRFNFLASNGGAFLFAFACSRILQEWHPQLVPAYYVVAVFAGMWLLLAQPGRSRTSTRLSMLLIFGGGLLQLYTAFYPAWFLIFSCSIAFLFALFRSEYRAPLFASLRQEWLAVAIASGLSLLLWPRSSCTRWRP